MRVRPGWPPPAAFAVLGVGVGALVPDELRDLRLLTGTGPVRVRTSSRAFGMMRW